MSKGSHIFIGGRDRGTAWLRCLAAQDSLPALVYCLEEDLHETERHADEITALCESIGVPVRRRQGLRAEDEIEIERAKPDLIVVMGWRRLLAPRVVEAPRFGTVAVHESLLPAYRGFAPINWAVINGETEAGVSLFYLTTTGTDDGEVVGQTVLPVSDNETATDLYRRAAAASVDLLREHFPRLLNGTAARRPQNNAEATYTCSRVPADGMIDWTRGVRVVHNLVRGLSYPYPGAFTFMDGARLTIWRAVPVEPAPTYIGRIPGRVVRTHADGVDVLCGEGVLRVQDVQQDGHSPLPASAVIRSVKATLGQPPHSAAPAR